MREVKLDEGKILHMPDTVQRDDHATRRMLYECACHKRLGNDFWFLPTGSCLRDDKRCDREAV